MDAIAILSGEAPAAIPTQWRGFCFFGCGAFPARVVGVHRAGKGSWVAAGDHERARDGERHEREDREDADEGLGVGHADRLRRRRVGGRFS